MNTGSKARRACRRRAFQPKPLLLLLALLVISSSGENSASALLQSDDGDTSATPGRSANGGILPSATPQYGFTMALLENNTRVARMGFRWVSFTVGWDVAEPIEGQFNWGDPDNIINAARSAGVNALLRVSRTPEWARNTACTTDPTCPPRAARLYGNFLGALATHVAALRGSVQVAYELWNEPNTDVEWGGLCPDPAFYTDMLKASYQPIKSADSAAIVIAGAVTTVGHVPTAVCVADDISFLRAMYDAGAKPYFDVLSDHPYGFLYAPETDPSDAGPRLVFRRAERHRELMVQNGDDAKQIWATEMGWALEPALAGYPQCSRPEWFYVFSPRQQSEYLARAYAWAQTHWPWMGALFTFNYDFSDAPWYDTCHPFRFWSVKERPAEIALRGIATGVYFSDVPRDNWAYNYIAYLGSAGIISGYSDNSFHPNDNATRGQFAKMIVLAEGWQANLTGAPHFSDVPPDNVFYSYIETAVNHGVIGGYTNGTFLPANNITRAQIAKIVVLTRRWPLINPPTPSFTDVQPDAALYQFVETAVAHGIISGYSDATFHPNDHATRAQISKILNLAITD